MSFENFYRLIEHILSYLVLLTSYFRPIFGGIMALIQNPYTKTLLELSTPIHHHWTIGDLPETYLQWIQNEGAGYFLHSKINTIEPTRFGLDYTLLNGIAGLEQGNWISVLDDCFSPENTGLPNYFIPFFKDESVYYCFDYLEKGKEPSIRLIDIEMDQWLTIASSFGVLINSLKPHIEIVDFDHRHWITKHTRTQQLGLFHPENFQNLLEIEEEENFNSYIYWIAKGLEQNAPISSIAKEALDFLLEYRKQELENSPAYKLIQHKSTNN